MELEMQPSTNLNETIFYLAASTMPFHLFAYIPFWNHLRLPKKQTLFILIAEHLLFMGIVLIFYNRGFTIAAAQLIATPMYGILFFSLVKLEIGKIAFLYIFATDYVMIVKGAAYYISTFLLKAPAYSYQSAAIILSIFLITMPAMLHYINRTAQIVFEIDAPQIWKTVWLLPLFNSIIVLLFTYPVEQSSLKALLARVLLMACMFLVYHFLIRSIQQDQKQAITEEHSRSVEFLLKLQTEQYAMIQQRIEEARRARHDLRHHWNVLQSYADSGNFDALSDYIRTYGDNMPVEAPGYYCDNIAANAVLCFYAQKAAQQQIKMDISFPVSEKTCIPEPELCVLLGNLLENALDACSACGEEGRCISVNAIQNGESSLVLTIDNTALEPVIKGNAFYSSKRPDFGLGTESVREIARRYHGDARFQWKDGVFYASVMLNSP